MTWREWRNLWKFEKIVDVPHLSVFAMCPYGFVRVLWHFNRREFQAWPSQYETGIVLGWRWPFQKRFTERHWIKKRDMPLAIYGGPMDEVYLIRAMREIMMVDEDYLIEGTILNGPKSSPRHIGPTVNDILHTTGQKCDHYYWKADCVKCARKALRLAIRLKAKYESVPLVDLHESPIDAFRRREAEVKARMAALPANAETAE